MKAFAILLYVLALFLFYLVKMYAFVLKNTLVKDLSFDENVSTKLRQDCFFR